MTMEPIELKPHQQREADYIGEYLDLLKGGVITNVGVAISDDNFGFEAWPALQVTTADGSRVIQIEVSRDPEGNGPGHLYLTDLETTEMLN